jgi:hypothetical protein
MQIAKPDRHLKRIAGLFDYSDVNVMCRQIADRVGDEISEIDIVFWRYATLERNYLTQLSRDFIQSKVH